MGAGTAGQLNADRRCERGAGVGVTPAPLYRTLKTRLSFSRWMTREKKKGKFWWCFASFFHLDAVVSSRLPFIVEFSNIINIEI